MRVLGIVPPQGPASERGAEAGRVPRGEGPLAAGARGCWAATPDDAPVVTELLAAFRDWWGYDEPPDAEMRASVDRLLGDPATDFLLGAADGSSPARGVVQLRYPPQRVDRQRRRVA